MNNELQNGGALNNKKNKKTSIAKQVILLGLSFILICGAITFFSIFALRKAYNFIIDSPIGLLFNATETEYQSTHPNTVTDTSESPNGTAEAPATGGVYTNDIETEEYPTNFKDYYNLADFPIITWGDEWATLSIPDFGVSNVPVFVGDTDEVLSKGVGKYFGSAYPGEIGNVILSAHVNRSFYHLQDLRNGMQIYLRTVWGDYVYEVTDSFIFDYTDGSILLENDGTEKLICYTCYPRGVAFRSRRYAVVCEKIAGGSWK